MGLVDRPLVLGLLAGWMTGRWDVALPMAITLELFWIDRIRLGAVIPPVACLGYLLLFPLTLQLDLQIPEQLPLPMLLCLSCAHMGAWLERGERVYANALADRVIRWNAGGMGGISPGRALGMAIVRHCVLRFLLYLVCYGGIYVLICLGLRYYLVLVTPLTWNMLYGVALMGGVLALRTRRAYAVLGCAMLGIVLANI